MKLTKKQLKEFILQEVEILSKSEGWDIDTTNESEEVQININEDFEDSTNITNEEIEKIELTEVKSLAEEFKRMKDLVDFRSPLLKKDI